MVEKLEMELNLSNSPLRPQLGKNFKKNLKVKLESQWLCEVSTTFKFTKIQEANGSTDLTLDY